MRILHEHAGLVHAPVQQVRDAVLSVQHGPFRTTPIPLRVDVDLEQGWIEARGQWWWCGRFEVRDDPAGARIVYRTYNLARGVSGRLVPFTVGRGHRRGGREALRKVLEELGDQFSCETELL
ncbi:hypothetical protein LWP59_03450 [Amycolatopsis acidiphila]|uniref:SRPBCC family protein n=1 Tax=Amycolatopsis acidiphila TaxID=715473 RepID=A0A557ZR01_9PSEU|nr:hypothetical protein [Amycolatopsis acidiphila]TVT14454.1 hypothetical protein FNH06_37715 [Amycolatopsis acidiphila]UIJ60752.1 hypothetical protein LWP59_03450 [Amycolatopsis acidiphila]